MPSTQSSAEPGERLDWNAAWSMAVGGMIGGGIFAVLGVVIQHAGTLAWLAFIISGLIALATAHSYVTLAAAFGEGGGSFSFLEEVDHAGLAGSLSWVLILGYVLSMAVYAFVFGHYAGEVVGLGPLAIRALAIGVLVALVAVNLRGVGESAGLEVIVVWGKILVLGGLAAVGLWLWHPERLSRGIQGAGGVGGVLVGAASVFIGYQGFQLLTYDYDDIDDPERTLPRASYSAVLTVIVIYIAVVLGAASLVGAGTIVEKQEIALAIAGQAALGTPGKWIMSLAAVFSTASAINATLFATARLAARVAKNDELPAAAAHRNNHNIPDRAVIALGAVAAVLAAIGSLGALVQGASLIFLFTFAVVNAIAVQQRVDRRWVSGAGAVGAAGAALVLIGQMISSRPLILAALAGVVALVIATRPYILRHTRTI